MISARPISAMVSALMLSLAACGGGAAQKAKAPEARAPAAPTPMPPAAQTPSSATATETGGALTDGQILFITFTEDSNLASAAEEASTKADSPAVRRFASMLVSDHQDHKKRQSDLAQRIQITPAESAASRHMNEESQRVGEALKAQRGPEFDRAYIDSVIREHVAMLNMLDRQLIPSARSADLKQSLENFRATLEAHLKEARGIQQSLLSGQ